jgi:hypothetical protein
MLKLLQGFTTFYRGRQITVGLVHHPKGLTARVQVDEGDWQYDDAAFWITCDEACISGVAMGRRLVEQISANDHRY